MPNLFIYLRHLVSVKKPPQPIKSPQYTVLSQEQINLIERLVKEVAELKKPEVRTHFANLANIEDFTLVNNTLINHGKELSSIYKRLNELENKSLSTRIRSVLAPKSWHRPRHPNGRFAKKGDGHVSA